MQRLDSFSFVLKTARQQRRDDLCDTSSDSGSDQEGTLRTKRKEMSEKQNAFLQDKIQTLQKAMEKRRLRSTDKDDIHSGTKPIYWDSPLQLRRAQ